MSNSPMYAPNTAMGSLTVDPRTGMMTHSPSITIHRQGHPYLTLKQMVFMRMRLPEGSEPFEFFDVHEAPNEMIIFAVVNGKPITLSDEKTLFPTDALITKLNLLRK